MRKWTKAEWGEIKTFYGVAYAVTGLPCVAMALFFKVPAIFLSWLYLAVGFPIFILGVIGLWAITAWPVALLLGAIFGRNKDLVPPCDPDGPGFIV